MLPIVSITKAYTRETIPETIFQTKPLLLSLILYINGQQADLAPGTVIAQTRQVNDLNSLENRQASYTNKFSLPKTAHNVRLMDYLTLVGNDSNIPYQKNECSLYGASGECFVYKGRAVITDGGDSFEAVVYDGIIDLYKSIENTTLDSLGLQAIDHIKKPATVAASWAAGSPYRYIFADYNGNLTHHTISTTNVVANMEYLVPSVNVKWLFNKIFSVYNNGILPTGAIFDSEDFTNLWMTFPKGANSGEEQETDVLVCDGIMLSGTDNADYYAYYLPLFNAETPVPGAVNIINNRHIQVSQAGNYRLEINGEVNANKKVAIKIGFNAHNIPQPHNLANSIVLTAAQLNATPFTYSRVISLNAGDSACIFFDYNGTAFDFRANHNNINVRLVRIEDTVINFTQAFSDFSVRDFLSEVVHRFGLTLFKDKYTNNYSFLTLAELLNGAVLNWSGKFIRQLSENYIVGSYAQRNWFTYTYNDKEANYNDGYFDIENINLPETKALIKSKIYSPENTITPYAGRFVNQYKMWDKEVTEETEEIDGQTITRIVTTYKPLDKRYYFLRSVYDARHFKVNSPVTLLSAERTGAWFESYNGLSFRDSVSKYYHTPLSQITTKSRLISAELWLSEADVANFDFKKRYHIEQLSGNFIINKINNYVPGKPTQCELLRVLPDSDG